MSAQPSRAFRVRRGRVRFKSGCELHVLPSFRERCTTAAHGWLDHYVEKAKGTFDDDMAGFVLVPWDSRGEYRVYHRVYGRNPSINTLPEWIAGALRRYTAEEDIRTLLDIPDESA